MAADELMMGISCAITSLYVFQTNEFPENKLVQSRFIYS